MSLLEYVAEEKAYREIMVCKNKTFENNDSSFPEGVRFYIPQLAGSS